MVRISNKIKVFVGMSPKKIPLGFLGASRRRDRKKYKTVVCGMSGGVDSSVAAALLKKQGYEVVGVHLRCWNGSPSSPLGINSSPGLGVSCADQDAEDARRAAEVLDIPFYVLDYEEEYKRRVVDYMVQGYRAGITPNPDVMCNKEIKFGLFLKKALSMGADYVATGHYVRLVESKMENVKSKNYAIPHSPSHFSLFQAKDRTKDQSYFLWTLTQAQLAHCLFPIGDYIKKTEVRKLAKKFGLPNAEKKDSQGICFLGQVRLGDFLKEYIPERKGVVLNTSGEVIGQHKGIQFYTIGQRSGVGVSGFSKPYYVAEKNVKENIIRVAEKDDSMLSRKEIQLTNVNFINPQLMANNLRLDVLARVRYRQPLAKVKLVVNRKSQIADYKLVFATPQKFVAPGQSAVFYQKKGNPLVSSGSNPLSDSGFEMLGGGVII